MSTKRTMRDTTRKKHASLSPDKIAGISEHPVYPRNVRVVIVPMPGFDRQGHRLGYGASYYDRFLSAYPHLLKIGLAFSCLETDEVPVDAHDICMNLIITKQGIIRCGNCMVPEK